MLITAVVSGTKLRKKINENYGIAYDDHIHLLKFIEIDALGVFIFHSFSKTNQAGTWHSSSTGKLCSNSPTYASMENKCEMMIEKYGDCD